MIKMSKSTLMREDGLVVRGNQKSWIMVKRVMQWWMTNKIMGSLAPFQCSKAWLNTMGSWNLFCK